MTSIQPPAMMVGFSMAALLAYVGTVLVIAGMTSPLWRKKQTVSQETDRKNPEKANSTPPIEREENAIYQNNRLVARVLAPEVDLDGKQIRFAELYHSDELLLPEDCEFQKYRILVQRVEDASRIDKLAPEKGRVLRGVVAEILGYREQ